MTHLTLIHDSRCEEAMVVATERHAGLVYHAHVAVEAALEQINAREAAMGYGPMTPQELAQVMGNMAGSILGERGISLEDFVAVLHGEWVFWEEPKPEARAKKGNLHDQ